MAERGKVAFSLGKGGLGPKSNATVKKVPRAFDEDDESDMTYPVVQTAIPMSKAAQRQKEDAEKGDASAFDYDGVYDKMKAIERQMKAKDQEADKGRKSKYMDKFMQAAEVRERDRLRAESKIIQRERAAEGDKYAGKESFVTSAYKEQQEELRRAEEEEHIREARERQKRKGVASFHQRMLDEENQRRERAIEALKDKDAKVEIEATTEVSDQQRAANAAALGRQVELNEENQIVDKRALLTSGLNVLKRKDPPEKQDTPPAASARAKRSQAMEDDVEAIMIPKVWAVNVSQWNRPPYTQVKRQNAAFEDKAGAQIKNSIDQLLRPDDEAGAEKALQYFRPIDRIRSLIARILPRVFCASEGIKWSEVHFEKEPGGRPFVRLRDMYFDFNLSHDGDWVVMGFTREPGVRVGVDVMEMQLPSFEENSKSFCKTMDASMTDRERDYVMEIDDEAEILDRLMHLWTYKEAYTKAIGKGLGCDFQQVEVAFWEDPIILHVQGQKLESIHWLDLSLESGKKATKSKVVIAIDGLKSLSERTVLSEHDAIQQGHLQVWQYDTFIDIAPQKFMLPLGIRNGVRAAIRAPLQWGVRSFADRKRGPKNLRYVKGNPEFRRFLEDSGFISSIPEPPRALANASAHALRRTRLPVSKAKALANASKALREQVAQDSISDAAAVSAPALTELDELDSTEQNQAASPSPSTEFRTNDLPEVVARATAQSYNFDVLLSSGRLPESWRWLEDREVIYIPKWPSTKPGGGSVFVFRSGCFVTWGMSSESHLAFHREVIQPGTVPVESDVYTAPGDEAMEYVHLPNETTRVVGDLIVIGQPPHNGSLGGLPLRPNEQETTRGQAVFALQSRLAFSQGIAASARLSVQESALSEYLASVSPIPGQLAAEGKVPLGRREVIRKLGTLLSLRQRVNLDRDNFIDDPEVYWENSRMETLYRSTCTALDIQPRFEALNEKLNHCENLLGVLRALLTEKSSHRMELIIIYLIAFEVVMAMLNHDYIPTPLAIWQYMFDTANPTESAT
ncbi:hypothetical protein MPSI1_000279 [Malassezia psittaci]|uniref:DUF155 domain-containing protein n=1 Tax=Malassezia psittaci TaxID=1821823 RepID=A0AAF0FBB2_9BASI|nr:hypothetical protein MPSI1_000279 [Malassezia psittaci]